jgi:putative heme transporter
VRILRRGRDASGDDAPAAVEAEPVRLDTGELGALATVFAPPRWLRDIGRSSWFIVGLFLLVAGVIWLLGATYTIVGPVVAAAIVATVTMPVVGALSRHLPRAASAALVLVGLVALGVVVLLVVLGGITAQNPDISQHASAAADKAEGWLKDAGVDESGSSSAKASVEKAVPEIISTLTRGIVNGIEGVTSLVFGLSFAALSLFFLLKDGPMMRAWVDRHLGVPPTVARTITGGIIRSLRGYFRGVTLVAAFNGVVVALGALVLGVPLAGTIGVVSFVTAYVPYIGAFVAGVFAVVIALGAEGTTTALLMLVIFLLANGLLQNLIQPFLMGSALDLNPLVVLVVTIGAGCIFGMLGLVLGAPLTSAAVHITRDLARARLEAGGIETEEAPLPTTAPT